MGYQRWVECLASTIRLAHVIERAHAGSLMAGHHQQFGSPVPSESRGAHGGPAIKVDIPPLASRMVPRASKARRGATRVDPEHPDGVWVHFSYTTFTSFAVLTVPSI